MIEWRPLLVVAALGAAACAADEGAESVALPGVEGAPRNESIEPPPAPGTTAPPPAAEAPVATDEPAAETATTVPTAPTTAPPVADTTVVAEPPPAATTTIGDDVFLRRGDEGPAVRSLQDRLIALDYLAPDGATGVFDGATADALIDFQGQYGLIVDGIFGPESDRALNAAAASVADG